MKKWSMLILAALLLMPLSAQAQDLPQLLGAVSQGLSQGLKEGIDRAALAQKDMTLALDVPRARIEEGQTLPLSITASNPYAQATDVTLTLSLPERLSCAQPLTWTAQLPGASVDPATGLSVPSVTTFTREVTLTAGGGSEHTALTAEMDLGTRFYRAEASLELCVPLISAHADTNAAQGRLVEPGDAFEYVIDIANDGTADKDVAVSMILPECVRLSGALPAGLALKEQRVTGVVRAKAASASVLRIPVTVKEDALKGEKDASRLLSATLTVDQKRVSVPMLQAVRAMISAELSPGWATYEEGHIMELAITLVNTGLAPADVEVACLLPEGMRVVPDGVKPAATDGEALPAAIMDGEEPDPPGASGALAPASAIRTRAQDGALLFDVAMDAAVQTDSGVAAATKEIILRVRSDEPTQDVKERLMAASLSWRVDGGEMQMSEAAVLRVLRSGFLGLSSAEWNGILLAALLMLITVCCLYTAVRSDGRQEDCCFD